MTIFKICNRIIEYSFYLLFFLVPLVIASDTSELFEFNKMWLTFGFSLVIAAAWITKMIRHRRIIIRRTPLDIPIALFLTSQVVSTIFSWDMHVSFWGYYSRFNGGLLSIITYIFLYYAFLSNFSINAVAIVKRSLFVSLFSGLVVALWGLPSHFGHDPTCFLFRQTFDVSCWTEDFQPKVRIFSTLGQPDWLAAYLAILLPISIAFGMKNSKSQAPNLKQYPMTKNQNTKQKSFGNSNLKNWNLFGIWNLEFGAYLLLSALFYLDLLYTRARSGILAVGISLAIFAVGYILVVNPAPFWCGVKRQFLKLLVLLIVLLSITFFIGTPFTQISKFTFEGINKTENPKTTIAKQDQPKGSKHIQELGGTDSGKIRAIVWKGAIDIWKQHPLFGTGVETFAFAYYRYKPAAQNLVSEWNFLYNKAHNEYLNYLATTGAFGLGMYLLMISVFIFLTIKKISKSEFLISNQIPNPKSELGQLEIRSIRNLILALLTSYLSILITNFFGFSVVITNIYLFMIPAFVFILQETIKPEKQFLFTKVESGIMNNELRTTRVSVFQWTLIITLIIVILYLLFTLFKFWFADKSYSLGYNLNRAGEYLNASPYLRKAVRLRNEPVFKDELAVNDVMLAVELLSQKNLDENKEDLKKANNLAQEAIETSNQLASNHEYNVVFWKTRTRIFYNLSQIDSQYLSFAISAIQKASELAPNDAAISYNLGVLYGQNNDVKKGIRVLENTIQLKPNYQDAHYALGLFYREEAVDEKGVVVNQSYQQKAVATMQYIIDHFPNNSDAKDALKEWEKK